MENFEDYLKSIHADGYMGTDDGMADAFEDWLGNLDAEEWLKYGEEYKNLPKETIFAENLRSLYNMLNPKR